MAKKIDGRTVYNSSHDNLIPSKDANDPRWQNLLKANKKRRELLAETKARREDYKKQLAQFKEEQMDTTRAYMDAGMLSPAELLMNMLKEQQIAVANPDLSPSEALKERALLMQIYDRYDKLTGASAPTAQSIDINSTEEVKTPEEIQKELLDTTAKLRVVNDD